MRRILLIIIAAATLAAAAATDRDTALSQRAARAYDWHEWASAAAMYELLLDRHPDSAAVYPRAIIASSMAGDTAAAVDLLQRAMAHGIALDRILDQVRASSFAAGAPNLYGTYLHTLRNNMPYMARALDHQLLRYYTFRDDGPQIVRYAQIMLRGLPDDITFLHTLARGYLLQADYPAAADTWRRILALDPDNLDALLYLGNYYLHQSDRPAALPYLRHAYTLHPTPYLQSLLRE